MITFRVCLTVLRFSVFISYNLSLDLRDYKCYAPTFNPAGNCSVSLKKEVGKKTCCCSESSEGSKYGDECTSCPLRSNKGMYYSKYSFKTARIRNNAFSSTRYMNFSNRVMLCQ